MLKMEKIGKKLISCVHTSQKSLFFLKIIKTLFFSATGQRVFLRTEHPRPRHHRASGEQAAQGPRQRRRGLHTQVRFFKVIFREG